MSAAAGAAARGPDELADLVGAVVVNHDAGEALVACVQSLRAAGVSQVVVVDNASRDGSLAALAARDETAVLVPTGRNLGYGSGANRGAARLCTEYLLICNPDLVLAPDAVALLLAELVASEDVALVGPRVLRLDGSTYPSARAFPSMLDAAGHALIGLFWTDNPWSRRYRRESLAADQGSDVDWVSGACLLTRRVAFESVGGFDEGYFMYVEDLDLAWRLRRAGWRVRVRPDARVTHAEGGSSRHHPYKMLLAHHRSTWRFAHRSISGPERALLPFVAAALAMRAMAACGREAVRRARAEPPGRGAFRRPAAG